jgi:hypothetical protein
MVAQLIRAAALAAATSAIGYALMAYRNSRALRRHALQNQLARQEWESDARDDASSRPASRTDSIAGPA